MRKLDLPYPSILWGLNLISLMKLTQRINLSHAGFVSSSAMRAGINYALADRAFGSDT
ncbi:MAG: hypothetical protein WBN29_02080 [Polyangiales bacterium]